MTESKTLSDAELRSWRESLGIPTMVLAELSSIGVEDIAEMEHGKKPVPPELIKKLRSIQNLTYDYTDELIEVSKKLGYIETARYNAEMLVVAPEYQDFGSMWHRGCARDAQIETGLPIRYPLKKSKVQV